MTCGRASRSTAGCRSRPDAAPALHGSAAACATPCAPPLLAMGPGVVPRLTGARRAARRSVRERPLRGRAPSAEARPARRAVGPHSRGAPSGPPWPSQELRRVAPRPRARRNRVLPRAQGSPSAQSSSCEALSWLRTAPGRTPRAWMNGVPCAFLSVQVALDPGQDGRRRPGELAWGPEEPDVP